MNQSRINFEYLESVDSTNSEFRRRLFNGEKISEYSVISADEQTGGRGRSGHEWQSIKGASISTSAVFYPQNLCSDAVPLITIVAAVAVTRTIKGLGLEPTIKWPNDVLVNEKKVCGILSEQIISGDKNAVIVGIGINLFPGSFSDELEIMATSISGEMEKRFGGNLQDINKNQIIDNLWNEFFDLYEIFLKTGSILFVLKEYNDILINRDRRVSIIRCNGEDAKSFEATAVKMNSSGRLIIKKDDGTTEVIDSGEVHVRGVYGYV